MTRVNKSTFFNLDRGKRKNYESCSSLLDGLFSEHRGGLALVCCLGLQLRHQRVPSCRHERTFISTSLRFSAFARDQIKSTIMRQNAAFAQAFARSTSLIRQGWGRWWEPHRSKTPEKRRRRKKRFAFWPHHARPPVGSTHQATSHLRRICCP